MSDKISTKNLVSVKQYALLKGVTRQTVLNWVNDGKVKRVEFLGKNWIDKSTFKQTV